MARAGFEIGGHRVAPGSRATVDLPVSVMADHTPVTLSVHVIHGRKPGPVMFVSAAVHGDEVIGVEIARRLLRAPQLDRLRGTLLVIPLVNTLGFLNRSRYLPDRRDLNRSFPGSARGSLAARLADLFTREVLERASFGIDLHSAAIHRTNLPQIRVSPAKASTLELAKAFGAPLVLEAPLREGSMRQTALDHDVDMLLYEAGEGLRFDEFAVRAGVSGALRVMLAMEMIPAKGVSKPRVPSAIASESRWTRAPAGGLMRLFRTTGETVAEGDVLGVVSDPFGDAEAEVLANTSGLIIGRAILPVVNEGDALVHIADVGTKASGAVDAIETQLAADPLFDEDEIL